MIGRIPIVDVAPVVNCGAWPAKAVVRERVRVAATVFREGQGAVAANVVVRDPQGRKGGWTPMRLTTEGADRFEADVLPTTCGRWTFAVEAWSDPIASWRHDAAIKIPAGQDAELVLEEGARLLERAAKAVPNGHREALRSVATAMRDAGLPAVERLSRALSNAVTAVLEHHPLREFVTVSHRFPLWVDRERALVGSWYEFFPRSEGASLDPPRSGTFATASARLPAIAAMGFDVVYLPPIHPIGTTFRKGANNALDAGPDDPGVPWAIGSPDGGHDAIHPDLGTLADFDAFVATARDLGLEVALDFALQCSPDHPWVTEHPEWFTSRADGTVAYAENPPKKYQDIYPLNFDGDYEGLYAEVLRVLRHWMGHGVRIFRVDNPHTKPVRFWERLLDEIRETDPDVVFLAEAFTRPAMMHTLAKVGFHQSYTYFTWRNTKDEIESYLAELAGESVDFLRPNFFVNTPDILHAYLQSGGPPAFKVRAVLAATAAPSWGVYSGYELYEHIPARPGSEEYLNSEKYQYRPRDWEGAERAGNTLAPYLSMLNRVRRAHPALRRLRNLHLHATDNPSVVAFSKRAFGTELGEGAPAAASDAVIVVINVDPHQLNEATVSLDLPALGLPWGDAFRVDDEITGASWTWGERSYVRLDPFAEPAHILTVTPTDTAH